MQTQEQSISPAPAIDLASPLSDKERGQLERCETVIQRGLQTFLETGNALATIRDQGLFRETHRGFRSYCRDKWNLGKTHAYRLIDDAAAVAELSPIGDKPANEAQARALAEAPEGERQSVWDEAVGAAPDGKVTAAHITSIIERRWPKPAKQSPTPEPPANDLRSPSAPDAPEGRSLRNWDEVINPAPVVPDAEARVEAMAETAGVGEIAAEIKASAGLSPAEVTREEQREQQPSPAAVRPPVAPAEPKPPVDKRKQPLKTMAELAAEKAEKAGKEPVRPSAWAGKTTAVIPNELVDRLAAVGGDVAPAITTYCDLAEILNEFGLEPKDALSYLKRFLVACCDHEEDPDDVIQAIGAGAEAPDAA